MRTLIKYLILAILIALLFSCMGCNKSIVGKTWYRGHKYSECGGTLIKADLNKRYSLFK